MELDNWNGQRLGEHGRLDTPATTDPAMTVRAGSAIRARHRSGPRRNTNMQSFEIKRGIYVAANQGPCSILTFSSLF